MKPLIFAELIYKICSHSSLVPEKPLYWTIIANPKAGGFTIPFRWKKHYSQLIDCVDKAEVNPKHSNAAPSKTALDQGNDQGLILTRERGHAGSIVQALIEEVLTKTSSENQPFFLIITAGGDGTSLEVLTALYNMPLELRSRIAVLRLPMGTGNDGADAFELDKTLDLIISPSKLTYQRAIKLITSTKGKGPFLAFNILSIGLDAFVTHMTNKTKGKLPGDFYKLWVDIAALLYEKLYKIDTMEVRALDDSLKEVVNFKEKLLLLAVGASGNRSYGSQKRILPDERNVCAIKQTPLFRKIVLKKLLNTGNHVNHSESILFNAKSLEIQSKHPILAQMDGETVLLNTEDFPLTIELSEPVIPILIPNTSP